MSIPTIEELRETRRRLAEQAGLDVRRYAAMLQAQKGPGTYLSAPVLPQVAPWRLPVTK
jgi:hypothetical protein